jgi:hypothetical protein
MDLMLRQAMFFALADQKLLKVARLKVLYGKVEDAFVGESAE